MVIHPRPYTSAAAGRSTPAVGAAHAKGGGAGGGGGGAEGRSARERGHTHVECCRPAMRMTPAQHLFRQVAAGIVGSSDQLLDRAEVPVVGCGVQLHVSVVKDVSSVEPQI